MKKIFFSCAACLAVITAFTQVRLGTEVGLNIASQHIRATSYGYSGGRTSSTVESFHLGFVADIPVATSFSVRPKLLLSGKGSCFKGDDDLGFGSSQVTFRPYYLELPVNAVYKYSLPNKMKLFAGFGPVLSFGLFGNVKSGNQKDDVFQEDGFKRFDFGLNYLAGIELGRNIVASLHYTQGLANIYDGESTEASSIKWKNRVFGISVAYMFDKL